MQSLTTPLDLESLGTLLKDLFGFETVLSFEFVHGGFMSQNFRIETNRGPFFLKQYRNRMNTVIHEIKEAEQFFAAAGLPVILPIFDRHQREAFWFKGYWMSLFPFVPGRSPVAGQMSEELITHLAHTLATLHSAGSTFTRRPFQTLRLSSPRKFHYEQTELLRHLQSKGQKTLLEQRMTEVLQQKAAYIQRAHVPDPQALAYDTLLHGDYQYYNLFTQDNTITHIYDLERASIGPTAYEVARSMLLNCFDDGWGARNRVLAQQYLASYCEQAPLKLDDFIHAMRLYGHNVLHTTWIEARYLIFNVATQLDLFNRHVNRVEFFAKEDIEQFCRDLFPTKN